MRTLLIATRNAHKAQEIGEILGPGFRCLTLKDFPDAPEVVEDAPSFSGNATKKATALAVWVASYRGRPSVAEIEFVLADDSGLEVDALNGAPGVHSARFAANDPRESGNVLDRDNNAKLMHLLREVPEARRTARFRCVLALARVAPKGPSPACSPNAAEPVVELLEGACEGMIGFTPRGQSGFGYDPLFTPHGFQETFAELGAEVKNSISHRAQALRQLRGKFGQP